MNHVKAIGFDLFNTLITVEPQALVEAVARLWGSLREDDIHVEHESFYKAHRRAAIHHIGETRRDGRETHNRFWVSAALDQLGFPVDPDDPRITRAVENYFSAFLEFCRLIPGTESMLDALGKRYRLGLLSNFTHPPAAKSIVDNLGISHFFEALIISGEVGYRKPHPFVFRLLLEKLGVRAEETLYVGDDPEPDIDGACNAGIQAVWTTYVRDRSIPLAPGVASDQLDGPGCRVPRISSWEDLLDLLDGGAPA